MWCFSVPLSIPRRWLHRPHLLLLLVVATALLTVSLQAGWYSGQWAAAAGASAGRAAPALLSADAVDAAAAAPAPEAVTDDQTAPQTTERPTSRHPPPPSVTSTVSVIDSRRQEPGGTPVAAAAAGNQTDTAERMRLRRDRIRRVCEANPKYVAPTVTRNVFYDRANAMVWCPVFKAGSTNWLFLLCEVHKLKHKCPIEILRSHLGPIPRYWKVPQSVHHRFLVVRHPFERLLSAFRDKIENNGNRPGKAYWTKAMRMVRSHRRRGAIPPSSTGAKKAKLQAPLTFPEFLRSVARQDVGDEHWKPYFVHCTPCNVDYDLIGKFETLEEDNRYIAAQIGIHEHTDLLMPDMGNVNKRGLTEDKAKLYFAQVTRDELMRVYKTFKMDFVMFNYTIDKYLGYVNPDGDDDSRSDPDSNTVMNYVI